MLAAQGLIASPRLKSTMQMRLRREPPDSQLFPLWDYSALPFGFDH